MEVMKMKRFTVVLVVMLTITWVVPLPKVGAAGNYWIKTFGSISDDYILSATVLQDGSYITVGHTYFFDFKKGDALCSLFDSKGEIKWSKTYGILGRSECFEKVIQDQDGGLIIGGSIGNYDDVLLVKLDSQGGVIWSKTYGYKNCRYWLWDLQITADKGYITGGIVEILDSGHQRNILITKLDSRGEIVWAKIYEGVKSIKSICQLPDGNYIIGGYTDSFGVGETDVLLIKLDSQGGVIWSKTYGNEYYDRLYSMRCIADGFIISGYTTYKKGIFYESDILMMKTDFQGNIVWSKLIGNKGVHETMYSNEVFCQTADGFLIIGDEEDNGLHTPLIIKLDAYGNIVSTKKFGKGADIETRDSLRSLIQVPDDDSYIVAGDTVYLRGTETPEDLLKDGLIMKINKDGYIDNCEYFSDIFVSDQKIELSSTLITLDSYSIVLTVTDLLLIFNDIIMSEKSIYKTVTVDTSPPEIIILSPQDNSFTNQNTILIKGTVKDEESGINNLFITGELVEVSSNGTFEKEITLDEGENQIDIVAEDNTGNKVEKVMKIVLDTTAPQIILNSTIPLDTHAPTLVITGQVVDKGLSGIKANAIQINGVSLALSRTFSFSYSLNLAEGLNQIILIVEDNTGNQTKLSYSVNYIKNIVLKLQIGKKVMYVDDKPVLLDVAPIIIENRTLLPIRWVAEPLGAKVDWDSTMRKVTITLKETIIELWIGKSVAKVNGIDAPIDSDNSKVVPEIINSRTMLPLRFIAENLGAKVDWDGSTQTITITYSNRGG